MVERDIRGILDTLAKRKKRQIYVCDLPSGKRTDLLTTEGQGKYIRYKTPSSEEGGDIALIPTILSAITHSTDGKLRISRSDYRVKIKRKKISTHTLIILDTSSSMMEGSKLNTARKCLEEIFLDTYQKRDRIGIITAGGEEADYLFPFTTNIEKGRSLVNTIPMGGTTPLSSGIRTGLRVLEEMMKREPWMIPLMVVITDGGANVPMSVGGSIDDDFSKLAAEMGYLNIRPLIINVGEDSPACREMVWKTDGRYLSVTADAHSLDLEQETKIDSVLERSLLSLASQGTTFTALKGYGSETIRAVRDILEENPVHVPVNEHCYFNCSPHDDPSSLCRECSLLRDEIPEVTRPAGLGWISEYQRTRDIMGELFVRYLVRPGAFIRSNNGLLFLEDEATYDRFSELLRECLDREICEISNHLYSESYPVKPRGVLLPLDDGYVGLPENHRITHWDMDIRQKIRKVKLERSAKVNADGVLEDMEETRKLKIEVVNQILRGKSIASVPDYIRSILGGDGPETDGVLRLMEIFAALDGRDSATLGDLGEALDFLDVPIDHMESHAGEYLFSKLAMFPPARDELRLALVEGYTRDEFHRAVEMLSMLPLTIETPMGCQSNCHPSSEDLCPECRVRWADEDMEIEEVPLPVVRITGGESLDELRGKLFVRYVLTSDTLVRANRGLLVIDSLRAMGDDVAEFLADVMESGRFQVRNEEYTHTVHTSLSVIILKDSEVPNKLLERYLGYVIKKEAYEDLLPPLMDQEGSVLASIHQRVEGMRSSSPTQMKDELLDYLVRICLELGLTRFDAETKIEKLARVMSVWEGETVTVESLDSSILSLAPMLLVQRSYQGG